MAWILVKRYGPSLGFGVDLRGLVRKKGVYRDYAGIIFR